jgi:hypothetical protein
LVAIGILPQPDAESEAIFKTLVSRNAVNMHAPAYSAAIVYSGENSEQVREKLKSLLMSVGVKN